MLKSSPPYTMYAPKRINAQIPSYPNGFTLKSVRQDTAKAEIDIKGPGFNLLVRN